MDGGQIAFDTAPYETMSATLLSQQPPVPKDSKKTFDPSFAWDQIFTHLEARMSSLRNWRWSWWSHWQLLAMFFLPRRNVWLVVANRMWKGSPINDAIIDSTATLAMETCASGMWSGLTNPTRPWIKLGSALPWIELDADGKEWLEDTEQRLYSVLAGSNFYTTMAQAFQDLTVFGTAPVIIYEDQEDVVRFYLPCAGEYYLACGARLAIDTLYREFTFTVTQIVEFATLDKCPEQVQKLWRQGGGSLDTEFVVAHAIEPNFALDTRGRPGGSQIDVVPGIFTYREVYWLKGIKSQEPLSKRGFRDKPFMAMLWSRVSNDPYGRSPCMDALGDTKQIQVETREKAEFIKKLTKPPMGANPELKNEPASIIPGHITYMSTDNNKQGFWPLFQMQAAALSPMVEDIKGVAGRIKECLFVDVFMAITQMQGVQPRNELELTKRDLERLQKLGPVIDLVEGELKTCLIRVMNILERRRLLKPKPKSLANVPLKIEFINIARIAQRSAIGVSMKDMFTTMGELSSAAKAAGVPDPIRVIDLDKSVRKYADVNNYPSDCIFTPDEVQQQDQIRAKATQQAQVPGQAIAAVNAAKTLADTSTGPGTALSALTGGAPPG